MYDDTLQTQSFILERKQVSMVMFPKVIAMKFQGGKETLCCPLGELKQKYMGINVKMALLSLSHKKEAVVNRIRIRVTFSSQRKQRHIHPFLMYSRNKMKHHETWSTLKKHL